MAESNVTEAQTSNQQPSPATKAKGRIRSLDALRGVAIGAVIAYHAYSRWSESIGWTSSEPFSTAFSYGYLGVELFFLISGFVIFMSLEQSATLYEFITKRWLRLFPAMLLSSALIYLSAGILVERPYGKPNPIDILPGLTFISPEVFAHFLGKTVLGLEGVFWSLYVEVKFYLLFGILFFLLRRKAIFVFSAIFVSSLVIRALYAKSVLSWGEPGVRWAMEAASVQFFGWFAAGAFIYLAKTYNSSYIRWSAVLYVFAIISTIRSKSAALICLFIYLLFVSSLFNPLVCRLITNRFMLLLGFVSYPMYLLHEQALVALTIKVHALAPSLPGFLTPVPALAILLAISYLIATVFESKMRKFLTSLPAICTRIVRYR